MRTHTALHVLCGVIWNEWGTPVTGGNMEPLSARMDFEFDPLPEGFGPRVEELVNAELAAARPIEVSFLPRDTAVVDADLIRTKVNLIPASVAEIRVVDIVGLDKQADGGTHVRSTDEVGRIRVIKTESKGKGNKRIRLEVARRAGAPAMADLDRLRSRLSASSTGWSSPSAAGPTRPSSPGWPATPSAPRRVLAATAVSPSLAPSELADCRALAAEWGLRWRGLPTDELADPAYSANDGERCYHCKAELLDVLGPVAAADGATVVLGVNVDDLGEHRPGQRAAAERGADVPAGRGRVHQGRRAGGVAAPRPAHVGQAGRRLPGLAHPLRDAGHAVHPALGRRRRGGRARASASASCGCATTATWPASS